MHASQKKKSINLWYIHEQVIYTTPASGLTVVDPGFSVRRGHTERGFVAFSKREGISLINIRRDPPPPFRKVLTFGQGHTKTVRIYYA